MRAYITVAGWMILLAVVTWLCISWHGRIEWCMSIPAWEIGMMICTAALGLVMVKVGGCSNGEPEGSEDGDL